MAMTWEEYTQKYGQPYDLSSYVHMAAVDRPQNYDDMRRANMDWQAQYYQMNQDQAPSAHETAMNPYIAGGNYYNQAADTFGQATEVPGLAAFKRGAPTDWAAEAAAGNPVIGGYTPPTMGPQFTGNLQPAPMVATQPGFDLGQVAQTPTAVQQPQNPFSGTAVGAGGGQVGNFWDDNNNQTNPYSMTSSTGGGDWQSMFDEWMKKQYGGA